MKTILRSQGLSCPSCVAKIEKSLHAVQGVSKAQVFFNTGRIEVEHDPQLIEVDALIEAVRSAGYDAKEAAF